MTTLKVLLCFAILLNGCWADSDAAEHKPSTTNENHGLITVVVNAAVQITQMSNQLEKLSDRLDQVEQQSSQLKSLQNQMAEVQEENSANIGALNVTAHPKQVAFTVAFKKHVKGFDVGKGGTLKYDDIITNIGNGYDPITGHFTAPYSGLYTFFGNVRRGDDRHNYITLAIYKENQALVLLYAESYTDPWENSAALTTIHLNEGESTYVRHQHGEPFVDASYFTTFSGMLVAAD